jgi:hypothetical protein
MAKSVTASSDGRTEHLRVPMAGFAADYIEGRNAKHEFRVWVVAL